jgi:hypothetical protein
MLDVLLEPLTEPERLPCSDFFPLSSENSLRQPDEYDVS